MAEDQGVNGDKWNRQVATLLSYFGWNTIGDYDMDIEGEDKKKYGIDTILNFSTLLKNNPQPVILESKRYAFDSFSKSMIQEWITRLDKKLIELKNSEPLFEKFPILKECSSLNIGIIAIWFHDTINYKQNHPKFIEALQSVKTSNKAKRSGGFNSIFVIDNTIILRLCSLYNAIKLYETEFKCEINYHYPSILIDDNPIARNKTLTIEYIYSKIILAEAKSDKLEENLVFYFGELETASFIQLKSLLTKCSFIDKDKSLVLFVHQSDSDFRKIEPDVQNIFSNVIFKIKCMDNLTDLPSYLKEVAL